MTFHHFVHGQALIVPTRERLEMQALALLVKCDIVVPPIPVEDIAKHVGICMIAVDDIQKSAILMALPGGLAGIILRRNDSPRRRRFSIAHEIGHRITHPNVVAHDYIEPIAARGGADRLERGMNYFAACLLMPRLLVGTWARSGASIRDMASLFDVSPPAIAARLRELGFTAISIAVGIWIEWRDAIDLGMDVLT